MLVGSTEYVNGPLTLAVEGMYGSFESLFDFSSPATPDMDYRSDYWGWYLKGDYRCTDWLALGCGYSRFTIEQTIDVAGMPGSVTKEHDQDDWFISIRFDITENLILKAEEHFVFGTAGVFEHENPDGVDDDWSMTLVKLSYVF